MKILIVKTSSLGDIIHVFPVLAYLKERYPNSQIDWVVEQPFCELVQAHPAVERTLITQTKKWRKQPLKKATWQEINSFRHQLRQTDYDVVLDLQGNVKSALVTANAKSPLKVGFNYASLPEWPNLLATHKRYGPPSGKNIREDYLFLAQSAFADFSPVTHQAIQLKLNAQESCHLKAVMSSMPILHKMKVMLCPGSNWDNKQLSKVALKDFMRHFFEQIEAHFLLIWGNQKEKEWAEELRQIFPEHCSIKERLSLPLLQNVMKEMDLVISMDSLPLHLAGTTATATYSIFGPSSANKYQPIGESHLTYQGSCPYGITFDKRCARLRRCQTGGCIKQLEGKELFDYFFSWWQGKAH